MWSKTPCALRAIGEKTPATGQGPSARGQPNHVPRKTILSSPYLMPFLPMPFPSGASKMHSEKQSQDFKAELNYETLREDTGLGLPDLESANGFLDVIPKIQAKEKIDKLDFIKMKTVWLSCLGVAPCTERLPVQNPVRAHAWCFTLTSIFLSIPFPLPSSLYKNQQKL